MEEKEILRSVFVELRKRGIVKSQKELADLAEVTAPSFSLAMNGKMTTRNIVMRVNKKVGNIFNPSWLITGEGEMLAQKADEQTFNVNYGSGMQVGDGNTYNEANVDELDTLRSKVDELQKKIAEREKTIARLEGKIEIYKEMLAK